MIELWNKISGMEYFEFSLVMVMATFVVLTEIALKYKPLVKWLSGKTGWNESECYTYFSRIFTTILWAVVPALVVFLVFKKGPMHYGIGLPQGRWYLWIIGAVVANTIMLVTRYFMPKVNYFYPEMTVEEWPLKRFLRYIGSWVIGLIGYEFLYRGLLFYTILETVGLLPAVVITSCMYGLAHIDRTMEEAFNSTYFNAALCIIVYFTHSIWVVYIIHLFIASLNSFLQIRKRPDMRFVR